MFPHKQLMIIFTSFFKGETAALADHYGLAFGLPIATVVLLKKRMQTWYSHGIGIEGSMYYKFLEQEICNYISISFAKLWI